MDVIYGRIFFALLATAGLVISIVLFVIHSEYHPGKSAQVRGYLKETNYQKDVYRGHKSGKFYKYMTDCVYTYRVDNVPYEVKMSIPQQPHHAPKSIMVTYQKKHPKRSCIGNDITYLLSGFIALFFFLMFTAGFVLTFFDI